MFDIAYYLRQAPDLIASGENPITHYEREGAARGLSPHRLFAADYYAEQVAQADAPSLIHYLKSGSDAGLRPHPLFDPTWYRETYPELAPAEPLVHFLLVGGLEAQSGALVRYAAICRPARRWA